MIQPYQNKRYLIIQAYEIEKINKPEFDIGRRGSEKECKQLIVDSQEYFQRYIENQSNESYYINDGCDVAYVFVDRANAVTVVRNQKGRYEMAFQWET